MRAGPWRLASFIQNLSMNVYLMSIWVHNKSKLARFQCSNADAFQNFKFWFLDILKLKNYKCSELFFWNRNWKHKQTLKRPGNSIISSAWPNQTYSHILSYWLIVCVYKMSANRRSLSLSALASFQYTTTRNYTIVRAL